MQLTQEARAYLLSRGYTPFYIEEEGLESIPVGPFERPPIKGRVDKPSILFPIHSMSDKVTAWHTAAVGERDYRTFDDPEHHYLPVYYGSKSDHEIMWSTGQVVMTEGVFDRIAVKRAFPERAVLARLTKGLSPPIMRMLERVLTRAWFCFDNDGPGNKAADRAEKRLKKLDVIQLKLPYKDPGKMYEKVGVEGIKRILGRQFNLLDL